MSEKVRVKSLSVGIDVTCVVLSELRSERDDGVELLHRELARCYKHYPCSLKISNRI